MLLFVILSSRRISKGPDGLTVVTNYSWIGV
jgi:hypothetical protein